MQFFVYLGSYTLLSQNLSIQQQPNNPLRSHLSIIISSYHTNARTEDYRIRLAEYWPGSWYSHLDRQNAGYILLWKRCKLKKKWMSFKNTKWKPQKAWLGKKERKRISIGRFKFTSQLNLWCIIELFLLMSMLFPKCFKQTGTLVFSLRGINIACLVSLRVILGKRQYLSRSLVSGCNQIEKEKIFLYF